MSRETTNKWNQGVFLQSAERLMPILKGGGDLDGVRKAMLDEVNHCQYQTYDGTGALHDLDRVIVRDCARAWRGLLHPRSERLVGESVLERMVRAARGEEVAECGPGFWAEMTHLVDGVLGRVRLHEGDLLSSDLSGRAAAIQRSLELDELGAHVDKGVAAWGSGLASDRMAKRIENARRIRRTLGVERRKWSDWRWQARNACRDAASLGRLVSLTREEERSISGALRRGYPFAVTPYYASLLDEPGSVHDVALRAQVIPPASLADYQGEACHGRPGYDYMLEADTSPVDLVTRRYPGIVILKPCAACPQVCVYCQRNWELDLTEAASHRGMRGALRRALEWIARHGEIHEVLITGGDPLLMSDRALKSLMDALAGMRHVERIRIGTRTPVTMPMRLTPSLCRMLASYQIPGRREVCIVTHVESVQEITAEFRDAMQRTRLNGLSNYNQHVYTFYVSRRYEAVALRRMLRLCGVDPYYTFYPKAKDEVAEYRVPIARMLQEQKEEARLMPGLVRTDSLVFNVPGLGKNPLDSWQHRDLVSVRPNGARTYEFHPWEKKVAPQRTFVADDVPLLSYLERLAAWGERPEEYESIWYYF